jgi:hypothetical protein
MDVLGLTGPRGRPGKPGTNGMSGIPGINAWTVKVNGNISSDLLIPPSIAGEYVGNCAQITSRTLRGVNVLSAVRGEYIACRWTKDFLLVSDKRRSDS